jgi:hypothetical protein
MSRGGAREALISPSGGPISFKPLPSRVGPVLRDVTVISSSERYAATLAWRERQHRPHIRGFEPRHRGQYQRAGGGLAGQARRPWRVTSPRQVLELAASHGFVPDRMRCRPCFSPEEIDRSRKDVFEARQIRGAAATSEWQKFDAVKRFSELSPLSTGPRFEFQYRRRHTRARGRRRGRSDGVAFLRDERRETRPPPILLRSLPASAGRPCYGPSGAAPHVRRGHRNWIRLARRPVVEWWKLGRGKC